MKRSDFDADRHTKVVERRRKMALPGIILGDVAMITVAFDRDGKRHAQRISGNDAKLLADIIRRAGDENTPTAKILLKMKWEKI